MNTHCVHQNVKRYEVNELNFLSRIIKEFQRLTWSHEVHSINKLN